MMLLYWDFARERQALVARMTLDVIVVEAKQEASRKSLDEQMMVQIGPKRPDRTRLGGSVCGAAI